MIGVERGAAGAGGGAAGATGYYWSLFKVLSYIVRVYILQYFYG
eukprot:SAG31_NODE_26712_length_437_cov_4.502959_1_plen_43_part_10